MPPVLGLVLSYCLGSIPTAYLAGKSFRGIDLRQYGSGNLGATNVYRVMGGKVATLVMAVDVAKGVIPVLAFPPLTVASHAELWPILYGLATILGHVRPVFLLGRGGGKGVATSAGVFLALAPVATLVAIAVWIIVLYASGYVSLASLSAAVALTIAVAIRDADHTPLLVMCVVVCAFVFWTHRANIGRLRRGEEHRLGRKHPAS